MAVSTYSKKVKNLLNKGTLTGFEVAKIVMRDLYELARMSEPELYDLVEIDWKTVMLIPEEIETLIAKNLRGRDDEIKEFNNWIGAFSSFLSIIHSAHILYLKIENLLYFSQLLLEQYLTEAIIRHDMMLIPEIITEKQYRDLKAKQRKEHLKAKTDLGFILINRANLHAEPKYGSWMVENLLEGSPEEQKDAVKYFKQASSEVYDYLKEGKLSITYQKKAIDLLERIQTEKPDNEILAIIDSTISREPEFKMKDPEPFLSESTATGEALYNTGWSEWIDWIDVYKHNIDLSAPYEVAVIQRPSPHQIDDKGHYKKRTSLADHPLLGNPDTLIWKGFKQTSKTAFTSILLRVKHKISLFLFKLSLAKILTEKTGINFSEPTDKWYKNIKTALNSYEDTLKRATMVSSRAKESLNGIPAAINLDEIQIKPEMEDKFRKFLSEPLERDGPDYLRIWPIRCQSCFHEEMMQMSENGTFSHSTTLSR